MTEKHSMLWAQNYYFSCNLDRLKQKLSVLWSIAEQACLETNETCSTNIGYKKFSGKWHHLEAIQPSSSLCNYITVII
jgi:hypothetical protein